MRILLFSNLYSPEPSGVGPYSAGLAASLAEAGHEVSVICANPSYPHWKLYDGYRAWRGSRAVEDGVDVHRCPVYVPGRVGGLTRLLHYASFAVSALVPALRLARRLSPDVVIHVTPTLIAAPVALLAARVAGATSWLHVQDFEVEAGIATGQMTSAGVAARLGLWFERSCTRGFDQTSSISPEMCRKLVEKGRDPSTVYELRNWAEIDSVRPLDHSEYRRRWSISTPHVALYSGSIARKQGIEIVIEAARRLRHRKDITFILCGNGPERKRLEEEAADLENFQFHDLQPLERLGELLGLATVHLLPQKAEAADLVLPSKLTNMLASGRPVVATAAPGTGLAREVEGCGIITPPEDEEAFARAIEALIDNPRAHREYSRAARTRAEERWDRSAIIGDFEARLRQVTEQRKEGSRDGGMPSKRAG